ncbi:nucleotidyltransferase domain-containing protein [Hydrogenimonas sp.]
MDRRREIVQLSRILALFGKGKRDEVAAEMAEGRIEWVKLVEVANLNFLTPALYYALKAHDLLDHLTDRQLVGFLQEVYERNRERNEGILRQLRDLQETFRPHGIPILLLKGAADLAEEIYPAVGMRMMNDIDIMISPDRFAEALDLLKRSGYVTFGRELGRWHHHTPRMHKEGFPAAIEPHFRILLDPAVEYIPYSPETSRRSSRGDLDFSDVLKPTWHLYHTFLHSAVIDQNHRKWRLGLRYLYDFVRLAEAYGEEVDWHRLYALCRRYGHERILEDFLYAAHRLFRLETPIRPAPVRGWIFYRKALWESTLEPDTTLYNFYRAYTEFKEVYSYEALRSFYGLNSKREYPFALLRYALYHARKYLL